MPEQTLVEMLNSAGLQVPVDKPQPAMFFLVCGKPDEQGEVNAELLSRKLDGRTPEECAEAIELEFTGQDLRWLALLSKEGQIEELNKQLEGRL